MMNSSLDRYKEAQTPRRCGKPSEVVAKLNSKSDIRENPSQQTKYTNWLDCFTFNYQPSTIGRTMSLNFWIIYDRLMEAR